MPPELDLSALVVAPDWGSLFACAGPLELEIGSGKGGFAEAYGRRHPGSRLVTLEMRRLYAEMTRARIARARLPNVLSLHADARTWATRLFRSASLDAVHVYFPDPWWKRRHFKRRVLDPAFSAVLLGLLRPGGRLLVRTDVEERAQDMLSVLTAAGFQNPASGFAPFDPEEVPTTRERRYLESGAPVWRMRLLRP